MKEARARNCKQVDNGRERIGREVEKEQEGHRNDAASFGKQSPPGGAPEQCEPDSLITTVVLGNKLPAVSDKAREERETEGRQGGG